MCIYRHRVPCSSHLLRQLPGLQGQQSLTVCWLDLANAYIRQCTPPAYSICTQALPCTPVFHSCCLETLLRPQVYHHLQIRVNQGSATQCGGLQGDPLSMVIFKRNDDFRRCSQSRPALGIHVRTESQIDECVAVC